MKINYINEIVTIINQTDKKYEIKFWDDCICWVDKDLCKDICDDIPF